MGGFHIEVEASVLKKASQWFNRHADELPQAVNIGKYLELQTWEALPTLYTPDLATDGPAESAPDLGPLWTVKYTPADSKGTGMIGLLLVKSTHPYVMGYEYGTPHHYEEAVNAAALHLASGEYRFSVGTPGVKFYGPYYPGAGPAAPAHNRRFALADFLRTLGMYGWTQAVERFMSEPL